MEALQAATQKKEEPASAAAAGGAEEVEAVSKTDIAAIEVADDDLDLDNI